MNIQINIQKHKNTVYTCIHIHTDTHAYIRCTHNFTDKCEHTYTSTCQHTNIQTKTHKFLTALTYTNTDEYVYQTNFLNLFQLQWMSLSLTSFQLSMVL